MVNKSPGRKLIGPPVILQDWDTEAEELTSKYWELFLDLLLVALSSALADALKTNLTWLGFGEFAVLYLVSINGYTLYTPQLTTRFEDSTLYHSVVLFPYLLGIAITSVNASFSTIRPYAFGNLLQRLVLLCMYGGIYYHIPRARAYCTHVGLAASLAAAMLLVAIVVPAWGPAMLTAVALLEFLALFVQSRILPKEGFVPVNIEHVRDRLGCLVLVMLGETVVAATIKVRTFAAVGSTVADQNRYYWTLGLSFLLLFSFTLLYFHMQPAPKDNAMRQSRIRGIMLYAVHKLLGMALLGVGVGVRLMVEAVVRGVPMSEIDATVMSLSVGSSLTMLFAVRLTHYGAKYMNNSDPPRIKMLKDCWWGTFIAFVTAPFLLYFANITDPVASAAVYAGLIASLCVIESGFTHLLADFLVIMDEPSERDPLQQASGGGGYQSIEDR